MANVPPPLLSLHQTLFACGVDNRGQFYGQNLAESIAKEVFYDRFYLKMDIIWESVEYSFTYFSRLTVTNGILNISPQKRHRIKALM